VSKPRQGPINSKHNNFEFSQASALESCLYDLHAFIYMCEAVYMHICIHTYVILYTLSVMIMIEIDVQTFKTLVNIVATVRAGETGRTPAGVRSADDADG